VSNGDRDARLMALMQAHVPYEVHMLRGTYQRIFRPLVPALEDRIANNAAIESFAIHARNLLEFFSNSRKDLKARSSLMGPIP
jgi:hypothetical protein